MSLYVDSLSVDDQLALLTAADCSFSILWIYSGASTYTAPTIFVPILLRLPT